MKLTYANKVAINENAEIPNINKVTDSDMNEIKAVVNNNDDESIAIDTKLTNATTYSTTETVVGTWMGKPIYRKVVNMGNLPNNGDKSVKHGLSNFVITTMNGSATNGSIHIGISGFNDEIYLDNTNIIWTTKANRSSFTAYVVLEYTKTTD